MIDCRKIPIAKIHFREDPFYLGMDILLIGLWMRKVKVMAAWRLKSLCTDNPK